MITAAIHYFICIIRDDLSINTTFEWPIVRQVLMYNYNNDYNNKPLSCHLPLHVACTKFVSGRLYELNRHFIIHKTVSKNLNVNDNNYYYSVVVIISMFIILLTSNQFINTTSLSMPSNSSRSIRISVGAVNNNKTKIQ